MSFKLPDLSFKYAALEPYIDAKTMEIHHTKHHAGYVQKLNTALERYPELQKKSAEELISNLTGIPEEIITAVRNNGGGHVNHRFFWQILSPEKQKCSGRILKKINGTFGGFDAFREKFANAALSRFGSGWAWLIINTEGKLEITSTANQDSPLMEGKTPILGVDVWEHSYYLRYQNKRADYLAAWWNVVNWKKVEELFKKAKK